jgi:hypothetical protein
MTLRTAGRTEAESANSKTAQMHADFDIRFTVAPHETRE